MGRKKGEERKRENKRGSKTVSHSTKGVQGLFFVVVAGWVKSGFFVKIFRAAIIRLSFLVSYPQKKRGKWSRSVFSHSSAFFSFPLFLPIAPLIVPPPPPQRQWVSVYTRRRRWLGFWALRSFAFGESDGGGTESKIPSPSFHQTGLGVGCCSQGLGCHLERKRERYAKQPTPLPNRKGEGVSNATPAHTAFPFPLLKPTETLDEKPPTHSVQHRERKEKQKSGSSPIALGGRITKSQTNARAQHFFSQTFILPSFQRQTAKQMGRGSGCDGKINISSFSFRYQRLFFVVFVGEGETERQIGFFPPFLPNK